MIISLSLFQYLVVIVFPLPSWMALVALVALPEKEAAATVPGNLELPFSSKSVNDLVKLFVPELTNDFDV